jgi:hypothetical protein
MQLCAYCGKASADTRDHVPQRSILARPYRKNLRTVPACTPCNQRFSKDEEYFARMAITLLSDSEGGDDLFDEAITRSFDRSPKIEESSWSALALEDGRPTVELDVAAIGRVAWKIVRGLFYAMNGHCLPGSAQVAVEVYQVDHRDLALANLLAEADFDHTDGPNFSFRVAQLRNHACAELWELVFFDSLCCAISIRFT